MFGATKNPAFGGLSLNTSTTNASSTPSLFGNTSTSTSTTTPSATSTTGGGIFGNVQKPPTTGSLFAPAAGTTQPTTTGSNMFGATQTAPSGGGLFQTPQPQTGNLFGGTTAGTSTTQAGGGLFGSSTTAQTQPTGSGGLFGASTTKPQSTGGIFGGATTSQPQSTGGLFGGATTSQPQSTGGLFGGATTQTQPTGGTSLLTGQSNAQQQQPSKPTLSLFGQPATQGASQPAQASTTANTVIPGVKVDLTNLLPTTKYESCADEIRNEIEAIDKHILNQMKWCHEVGDLLPTIENQGASIPNDVDFVQGKLETIQHALENDASDIDRLRDLVARDAAEAQVAFRAIDTLKLPLQYQSNGGGWWSVQDHNIPERAMRSSRKNTLALPDGVEGDASATSVNGVPVNLIDYFSHRSKEMKGVLGNYTGNLKEIEDHLHGVEATLNRQISDFLNSKSRDGASAGPKSTVNELAAVLADVEAGIMGVASRLTNVSEQVQDLSAQQSRDGRFYA